MTPDLPQPGTAEQDRAVALSESVERALSFQAYEQGPLIEGVRNTKLRKHRSENGWFTELLKLDMGGAVEGTSSPGMSVRQVSCSYAEPGRINAFHIHPLKIQDELWTVLSGTLLVWLIDCRSGSGSEGVKRSIVLSGEEPSQLLIPAGVAHGYRAGSRGATLLYVMNQQFDPERPNEGRLPWDFFGSELWEDDRG